MCFPKLTMLSKGVYFVNSQGAGHGPLMEIITPSIAEYLGQIGSHSDPVILEMEEHARHTSFPIVGPQVGALLGILARTMNATRIFEIGSGFGYSAYWFAKHTGDSSHVVCTEFKEENIRRGMQYLARGNIAHKVRFVEGNGIEILRGHDSVFDIIFNDADKDAYPTVPECALPRLRKGGLLITDNALWKGRVAEGLHDEATAAVHVYNTRIMNDPALLSVILPIRDGVAVSVKL